jgi:ketosteroid isomerase-like protein
MPEKGSPMDERDAVLVANATFYRAFADADTDAMEAIWADDRSDISVVHPGAPAIVGRTGVLESWRAILNDAGRVDIRCVDAQACMHGDFAIVLCNEIIQGHTLVAANIFCRAGADWRLVHHQAGACQVRGERADRPRPVLH